MVTRALLIDITETRIRHGIAMVAGLFCAYIELS